MNEELLTVPKVLAELRVPRSTWFYWRQTGKGPRVIKLPNGQLRVRRSALGRWLGDLEQDAACRATRSRSGTSPSALTGRLDRGGSAGR